MSDDDSSLLSGSPLLTIRQDGTRPRGVWDLYLGQKLVVADLGIDRSSEPGSFKIYIGKDRSAKLLGFNIFRENPLFRDRNLNGIEDSFEIDIIGEVQMGFSKRSDLLFDEFSLLDMYLESRNSETIRKKL